MTAHNKQESLAPLPVRLIVYAVVIAVGIGCVQLVDHRAMQRMHEPYAQTQPKVQNGNG